MNAGAVALICGVALLAVVVVTEVVAAARGVDTGCLPLLVGLFAVAVAVAGLHEMGMSL